VSVAVQASEVPGLVPSQAESVAAWFRSSRHVTTRVRVDVPQVVPQAAKALLSPQTSAEPSAVDAAARHVHEYVHGRLQACEAAGFEDSAQPVVAAPLLSRHSIVRVCVPAPAAQLVPVHADHAPAYHVAVVHEHACEIGVADAQYDCATTEPT